MSFKTNYQSGDRIYNHRFGDMVIIQTITITPQKLIQYHYITDNGVTGVASDDDLGDPVTLEDLPDLLYINMCSISDISATFPNLPGGKGVLARKIVKARTETPFDNEINFINRMLEIDPKVEWEAISYKLNYDLPDKIGE
jgi:hypothetical protein